MYLHWLIADMLVMYRLIVMAVYLMLMI